MDFGQPNTTIFLSTNDESEMEKLFKDINLDALDFKLSLIPIINKIDDQQYSFLSEIPEEMLEPDEE